MQGVVLQVLDPLQDIAHGHETTISLTGLNGVLLESTFSAQQTRLELEAARQEAQQRETVRKLFEQSKR